MSKPPTSADLPYLRTFFVSLDGLARAHDRDLEQVRVAISAGWLPRPAYVLADGTQLVAPDFFALSDTAGGDQELSAWFTSAYVRAASGHPEADPPEDAWRDYLSGIYATCLRSLSPVTIVRKAVLMARIESLIDEPQEGERGWDQQLRAAVDALDVLERPFAEVDRVDGPVSRDRLITAVRACFPIVWSEAPQAA